MKYLPISIGSTLLLLSFNTSAAETDKEMEANLWDGFYLGASLGNTHSKASPNVKMIEDTYFHGTDDEQLNPIASKELSGSDFSPSILTGYHFQKGNLVYGIEGDVSFTKFEKSNNSTGIFLTNNATFELNTKVSSDWLVNLRAKIGYTFNDSLLFFSLGPSLTKVQYQFSYSDPSESSSLNESKTTLGISAGVGYEYKFSRNFSFKADYAISQFNSIDFGKNNISNRTDGFTHDLDLTSQVFRIGFSRYF